MYKTITNICSHPLNRRHLLESLSRYLRWQLGSRIAPGAIVFDWVNNTKFIVSPGETGLTGNVYCGLFEFADMAFTFHFLRPSDTFVDVGANAGSYTILACGAAGAKGMSFEPVPETFTRLRRNIAINNLGDSVSTFITAVGAATGEILFHSTKDTTNRAISIDEPPADSIRVPVTTLDFILHGCRPALIKIDVEGFEALVLEGAKETLRQDSLKAIIMELNGSGARYGHNDFATAKVLFDAGFDSAIYEPFSRQLSLRGTEINSRGNTLFVRDIEFAKNRLASAPTLSVLSHSF